MINLYRKELRALLPLQLLMILTFSGDLLFRPLSSRLDELSLTNISSWALPDNDGGLSVALIIFGLLVAYSLLPREHDEKTIELLYSLPVSRLQVFCSKVAAGWTVLALACLAFQCTDWVLQSFNDQSFVGNQWRLSVAFKAACIHSSVAFIVLSHGVLISFLRRFGLIPYALAGWAVVSLEQYSPLFAHLNFFHLTELEYEGSTLIFPWAGVALHVGVALVVLSVAAVLWTGQGERLSAFWARLPERRGGRLALGCATALVVMLVLIILTLASSDSGSDSERPTEGAVHSRRLRVETERFVVTYPEHTASRSLQLVKEADSIHERLRLRLGAAKGSRVIVDLTGHKPEGEGVSAMTTVRVGVVDEGDPIRLRRVFAHELAHTFQSQLIGGDQPEGVHFFIEGSAEHLAHELYPDPQALRSAKRAAVVAWARHRVGFDVLAHKRRLSEEHDPLLVYTLGMMWARALESACGPESTGAVLRAMGREEARRGKSPVALWQSLLSSASCGLEPVLSSFAQIMARTEVEEEQFLKNLPTLRGGVQSSDGKTIVVEATADRPPLPEQEFPELRYLLRVRDNAGMDIKQTRAVPGEVLQKNPLRVRFEVPRRLIQGHRFELQLGQRFDPDSWAVVEPWQSAVAP